MIEIIDKRINKNQLLHRDEVYLLIKTSLNIVPSKNEVKEFIKNKFNVQEECIDVDKIISRFGSKNIEVHAFIYENKDFFEKLKKKKKKEKEKSKEEKVDEAKGKNKGEKGK